MRTQTILRMYGIAVTAKASTEKPKNYVALNAEHLNQQKRMNLNPTPATNNPPKTNNQLIIEFLKAQENDQLARLEMLRALNALPGEIFYKGKTKYECQLIAYIQDMRPAPIKKLVPLEQVIECLPQKLTDAQKAMLGVAGF